MTCPLIPNGVLGTAGGYALALLVGVLFGFFLERAGFGSARKLAAVFYGRDMTVLKVMFTAIVTAMIGLQYLVLFGRMDPGKLGVLPTYLWPQVVGGLVFGVGFVLGGYCPGTALVGIVSGRRDALVFLAGLFIGTGLWGCAFPALTGFYSAGSLGPVTLASGLGLTAGVVALIVACMALVSFRLAHLVEETFHAVGAGAGKEAEP